MQLKISKNQIKTKITVKTEQLEIFRQWLKVKFLLLMHVTFLNFKIFYPLIIISDFSRSF